MNKFQPLSLLTYMILLKVICAFDCQFFKTLLTSLSKTPYLYFQASWGNVGFVLPNVLIIAPSRMMDNPKTMLNTESIFLAVEIIYYVYVQYVRNEKKSVFFLLRFIQTLTLRCPKKQVVQLFREKTSMFHRNQILI